MKKTRVYLLLAACGLVLAGCDAGTSSSSSSTSEEPPAPAKTLWDDFVADVTPGNGVVTIKGYQEIIGLDPYTFIVKYQNEYRDSYYDTGLAYVEGIGYCSFVDNSRWEFSDIHAPATSKIDISTHFRTITSFGRVADEDVTSTETKATITNKTYCANIANMTNDWAAGSATSVDITAITGGYQITAHVEKINSWDPEPHDDTITITGFGEQAEPEFTAAVAAYTPSVWNGKMNSVAEAAFDQNTYPELRTALESVSWSTQTIASSGRSFTLYDFSGDKTAEVVSKITELGFELERDSSDETSSFFVYHKINETSDYTSGEYYVNVIYYPATYFVGNEGFPAGSYPNGQFYIYLDGINYLDPTTFTATWNAIEVLGFAMPTFDGLGSVSGDCFSFEDSSMYDMAYYSLSVNIDKSDIPTAYTALADYAKVVEASPIGLTEQREEWDLPLPALDDFNEEAQFYASYTYVHNFRISEEYHQVSIGFILDYDPGFWGPQYTRVTFWYRAY